jgi:hypothetical protein
MIPFRHRPNLSLLSLLFSISLVLQIPQAQAGQPSDLLADLQMAPLRDFQIELTPGGQRRLRFTAEIVNLGDGPFELVGTRPSTSQPEILEVRQRIVDGAGVWRERPTSASMFFAGDGHTHWHVRDLEEYTLTPLDDPAVIGVGMKGGYCFSDNNRYQPGFPGAPPVAQYRSCGGAGSLTVTMGLSVGWGDIYGWDLPDQYIDITGLPPGRYRLHAIADPDDWFTELDETNNATAIDLRIIGETVDIYVYSVALPSVARSQ